MHFRRFFSIVVCIFLICGFCSCSSNSEKINISMNDIIEVNINKSLLNEYNSFSVDVESGIEKHVYFVNSDLRYEYDGTVHNVINDDGHFQKYDNGEYATVLYAGVKPASKNDNIIVSNEVTGKEEILDCFQKDDKIVLKSRLSENLYKKFYEKSDNYANGVYLENEYVLNSNTLEIISMVETVFDTNGKVINVTKYNVSYNAVMPVEVNDIIWNVKDRKAFVNDEKNETLNPSEATADITNSDSTETEEPENVDEIVLRSVTVTLDPGTDEMKEYSTKVFSGNTVNVIRPEGYDKLFLDEELTVEFKEDDLTKDIILYSAKGR